MSEHVDLVESLAEKFRSLIEVSDKSKMPLYFDKFPKGACGDTCILLAQFLIDNDCGSFNFVDGRRGEQSHAWLEQDGLIIDITGDQFNDFDSEVYVSKDRTWYDSFEIADSHEVSIDFYGEEAQQDLWKTYKIIVGED